jgi:hypothetical protein
MSWPRPKCTECGKEFNPWRERPYGLNAVTCGSDECQRKRKTRLQKERRLKQHPAGAQGARTDLPAKQRGSMSPHRAKGPGWGNALKQPRSTLPQPPEGKP